MNKEIRDIKRQLLNLEEKIEEIGARQIEVISPKRELRKEIELSVRQALMKYRSRRGYLSGPRLVSCNVNINFQGGDEIRIKMSV